MTQSTIKSSTALPPALWRKVNDICNRFEAAWKTVDGAGTPPDIGAYLSDLSEPLCAAALTQLVLLDADYRRQRNEKPPLDEYQRRFPALDPDWLLEAVEEAPEQVAHAARRPTDPGIRYRIVRPHARGGLGQVFVAEDQELRREVALKEILADQAGDPRNRSRFVLEAEITGNLEHPGVVPVYGLGTYPDGRPFYAMRFIKGESLKDAIRSFHDADTPGRDPGARSLALRQLLRRFIDMCNAVAYAHSRGVIHRDLKPANVMLGKYGETLVVDWGLAKTVGRQPTNGATEAGAEATLRPSSGSLVDPTQLGLAIGTPAYMSPEQAAGKHAEIGPASDVYSLGATLYSLLTSKPPVDGAVVGHVLAKVTRGEIRPPRQVKKDVPSALDAICRMAMSVQPRDRYGVALDLAAEIDHWLADEPVAAYREPFTGRIRRWLRRHRTLATSAAATLVVTVVLLGGAALLLNVARQRAEHNMAAAKSVTKFMTEDFLAVARPDEKGRQVTIKEALDAAAPKVGEAFAGQPEVEAEVRATIAETYYRLGYYRDAEPHLRRALDLYTEHLGPHHENTLSTVGNVGLLLMDKGNLAEAEPILSQNLEACRRYLGLDHTETLGAVDNMAALLQLQGKLTEAEPHFRQNLEDHRRLLGPDNPKTLKATNNLAGLLRARGKLAEAEPLLRDNLEAFRRSLGLEHSETLTAVDSLALLLRDCGKFGEAEPLLRQNLDARRRILGPDHPDTLSAVNNIAAVLVSQGKLAEAEPLHRQNMEHLRRTLGSDHPATLAAVNNLAIFLQQHGKPSEAEPLLRQNLEARRRVLGNDHSDTLDAVNNFTVLLHSQGKLPEVEVLLRENLEAFRRALGSDHPRTLTATNNLGQVLKEQGKLAEAEPILRENLDAKRRILGADHPETLAGVINLAGVLLDQGKLVEAELLLRVNLETSQRVLGLAHPQTVVAGTNLAALLKNQGKLSEAEQLCRANLEACRTLGPDHPYTLLAINDLAVVLQTHGKPAEAEPLMRETLDARRRVMGPDHPETLTALNNLAGVLKQQGKWSEAEPLFRDALDRRRKVLTADHPSLAMSLVMLGEGLTEHDKAEAAEPLLREGLEILRQKLPEADWKTGKAESSLGRCLVAMGKYADAEPLLLKGYGILRNAKGVPPRTAQNALDGIIRLYEAWNKPDEAAEWRAKRPKEDEPNKEPMQP